MTRPGARRLATVLWAALIALVSLPAASASAADVARRLPVETVRGIVADGYGHVFVATDEGVLVTDGRGATIKTISYNQVLDLSLSPNGKKLYLAERGNVAVSVYKTTTLKKVARYALPPGLCPVSVARTAHYVAFGYACDGERGGVGFLSVAEPTAKPVTYANGSFAYNPLVRVVPGSDQVVAAAAWGGSVGVGVVAPAGVLRDSSLNSCANLQDLAVAPDGRSFVPACGLPYRFDRYDIDALAISASYLAKPYPNAVAFSRTGRTLAGGVDGQDRADLFVYPAGQSPRKAIELGGVGVTRGVAFSRDGATLYAIGEKDGNYVLHTFPGEQA